MSDCKDVLAQERFTIASIDRLRKALTLEKERNDHLDATVYANSDWGSASRKFENRFSLAIELLEKGVSFVEPLLHHGVGVSSFGIISPTKNRWFSYRTKQWYWYSDVDTLLKKLSGDNSIDVKALMLKKQKEQPTNEFWKDEQGVRDWLKAKGKTIA